MSKLLPYRSSVDHDVAERRVVTLNGSGHEVIAALQSETAQEIVSLLHNEPMTHSDLAIRLDRSVQAIGYHLDNLCEADLVTIVDTWYSKKGREMDVYAPTAESVIVTVDK